MSGWISEAVKLEAFAAKFVLHPPSTADMLKAYAEHELKPY